MGTPISIPDLLTILTTSGVAIYVVGLVGLAIAMRLEFTDDVSTAWYAVALLPRTIVAGQGVRIWLRWSVPYALFATGLGALIVGFLKAGYLAVTAALVLLIPASGLGLLALFYASILSSIQKEQKQPKEEAKLPKGTKRRERLDTRVKWLSPLLNSASRIVSWLFPPPSKRKRAKTPKPPPGLFGHFVLATIMAGLGGIAMSLGALVVITTIGAENVVEIICGEADIGGAICSVNIIRVVDTVANDPSQGVFSGIMLFIAGGFFVGISAAATVDHPLPPKIVGRPTSESRGDSAPPLKGYLVTHADGFWHLFDIEHHQLLSIPDAQVSIVQLAGEAESRRSEDSASPEETTPEGRTMPGMENDR
jgi:hypothetical protein